MSHSHHRYRDDSLDDRLLERARESALPEVRIVVSTADGRDAGELRARQFAALVRLLRHAVEIRRAT